MDKINISHHARIPSLRFPKQPLSVIYSYDANASSKLTGCLYHLLPSDNIFPVFVCIGSDRSTGDALGPLVGEQLNYHFSGLDNVWGTLKNPVHASNLKAKLQEIYNLYYQPFTIAIDASLGNYNDVGNLEVGRGPLKPGKAVQKNLPETGNLYIRGVVNVGGFMEQVVLQSTRLYLVTQMAQVICKGLLPLIKDHPSTATVHDNQG